MDKGRWQAGFFTLLVLFVVGGVLAGVVISGQRSDLVAARQDTDRALDQLEEVQADLRAANADLSSTENDLADLRKKYREVRGEVVTAEEAEAFAVEGLSSEGTDFTCLDFRCLRIKARITFFNDTDTGSPVTCVLEVTHENGQVTHSTITSPYVPPQGEDNQVWYYFSPLSGTEIDTYLPGECKRDDDPSAGGD